MAGHSKWANIKRHKAKQDAKRGKLYNKLIREIKVAAKLGSEPSANPRLRVALDKALEANMTRDVIDRAIKRGAGGMEEENLEEIRYEGYGPGGIAVIVDCMTNNRNRTVGEVRHIFTKYGGNLGTDGSVAYLFKKQACLSFPAEIDNERLMEHALELGVEDIITNSDNSVEVIALPEALIIVKETLTRSGFQPISAEVTLKASTQMAITDKEQAEKFINFIDALEDLDDVQVVYTNADITEEILNELS